MTNKITKIPQIRFNDFTEDWEQRELREHAKYRRGSFPQPYGNKEWYDGAGSKPFVQVVDVGDNLRLVDNTKQKISLLAQSKSVFVPAGKVVVTLQGSIGRVAITQYDSFVDRTLLIFDEYQLQTNEYFWAYTIQQKFEIEKQKAPGGTIKTITKEALSDFEVYLPEYEEQKKVGNFFKQLNDTIALHQREYDLLKLLKQGYLQKMIPRKENNESEVRFENFKETWKNRKIKEIFKVTRGHVLASTEVAEEQSKVMPYPVYSSQTKNDGLMGYYKEYLFDTAITWTTDGANAGTVNYREGKFYSTNVNGVLLSDDGYTNEAIAEILNKEAWKWVSHVGNPKLMNNIMEDITICTPQSIEEQNKLSIFFKQLDNIITLHHQNLDNLKQMKKSLLQKMFV